MRRMTEEEKRKVCGVAAIMAALALVAAIAATAACSAGVEPTHVVAGSESAEAVAGEAEDAVLAEESSETEAAQSETTEAAGGAAAAENGSQAQTEGGPSPAPAAGSTAEAGSNVVPAAAESASATNGPAEEPAGRWVEETQRVWVVDQEAWSEQLPAYETRERSICNICGADITGATSPHNKQHMLAGEGSGYHSEVQQVQVGTRTVTHDEVGHWETVVTGGHWE